MVGDVDLVAGNEFQQLFFGSQRRFGVHGKADAGCDAEDVGVDRHVGLVIDDRSDDIGGFAADAGEAHQFFDGQRYFAAKIMDQHLSHADQVFRLVIGIGNAPDQREELIKIRFSQAGGVRIFVKDGRGRHIDPLIRALCREDDRYQQLVGVVIQ